MSEECGRTVPHHYALAGIASYQQSNYDPSAATELGVSGPLHDLAFPYAMACRAIAVTKETAQMLKDDLERRDQMDTTHMKDWAGGKRDEFEKEWGDAVTAIETVISRCETKVGDIEDAWDFALDENGRRSQNRADYDEAVELQEAD